MTSIKERAKSLLSEMTLREKLAQLGGYWVFEILDENLNFSSASAGKIKDGIGQITRLAGSSNFLPRQSAEVYNQIQKYLIEETRLGIPALVHEECCSGFMSRDATVFPQAIGVACTFEPELNKKLAEVIREQMRATGGHQGLSPLLDITRDPRWGRIEETYGEDPYLVSAMGVNFVDGLQGDSLEDGIIATAKHFVGYGQPEGGMNWAPTMIPERELREVYMLPFEAAVRESNLQSVMNAYHEIDGEPCVVSEKLLIDILRKEWGFDGLVVSDYFSVEEIIRTHKLTESEVEAAALALQAGIDIELPSWKLYQEPLETAVESGLIEEALVDRSVLQLLTMKYKLGLFDNPYIDPEKTEAVFNTPVQLDLAKEIAQKSIVLLKNENDFLPLSKDIGKIAVIGPNADNSRHMLGDYVYECHVETLWLMKEEDNVFNIPVPDKLVVSDEFGKMPTILEGLRTKIGSTAEILYAPGCEILGDDQSGFDAAVKIAKEADVAILVVGGKSGLTDSCTCGEARDRADLNLTGVQEELIKAVHATGTPVVVILINGRPLTINWADENVSAILEAWLPGQGGADAVADVLFGDVNPGGKLAATFPRTVGQVPIYYRVRPSGGRSHWKGPYVETSNTPLYPFGYGLSYTTFSISDLKTDRESVYAGEKFTLSVKITNTGAVRGEEVVQLYGRDVAASLTRPIKELKGFLRIALDPGESKQISFEVSANQFGFYNKDIDYVLEPGKIKLMLGTSSDDLPLETEIDILGEIKNIADEKVFFSTATCK